MIPISLQNVFDFCDSFESVPRRGVSRSKGMSVFQRLLKYKFWNMDVSMLVKRYVNHMTQEQQWTQDILNICDQNRFG